MPSSSTGCVGLQPPGSPCLLLGLQAPTTSLVPETPQRPRVVAGGGDNALLLIVGLENVVTLETEHLAEDPSLCPGADLPVLPLLVPGLEVVLSGDTSGPDRAVCGVSPCLPLHNHPGWKRPPRLHSPTSALTLPSPAPNHIAIPCPRERPSPALPRGDRAPSPGRAGRPRGEGSPAVLPRHHGEGGEERLPCPLSPRLDEARACAINK